MAGIHNSCRSQAKKKLPHTSGSFRILDRLKLLLVNINLIAVLIDTAADDGESILAPE